MTGCALRGRLSLAATVSCDAILSMGKTSIASISAKSESFRMPNSSTGVESASKSSASVRVGNRKFHWPICQPPSGTIRHTTPNSAITIHMIYAICLGLIYFLHNALVKSSNTVKISRRPISITKLITHLATIGNSAYVPAGPN